MAWSPMTAFSALPVLCALFCMLASGYAYLPSTLSSRALRYASGWRSSGSQLSAIPAAADVSNVHVMVNGLPGPMALETAKSCLNRGFHLVPLGFTGSSGRHTEIAVEGDARSQTVQLVKGPGFSADAVSQLKQLKAQYPGLVIVDYTHPSAALVNAQAYVDGACDFVMGTTGGDPAKLSDIVNTGSHAVTAVIAPNMGKQIVAMQAALLEMSRRFPGSFEGYTLDVVESHQSSKADTSGTAKAVVASLSALNNVPYPVDNIQKIRDRDSQLAFGVPEDSLAGHAFHTYRFTSPDKSVVFELKHNVCGRKIYAEGTADAIEFVHRIRGSAAGKKLFNMIDVLESGGK